MLTGHSPHHGVAWAAAASLLLLAGCSRNATSLLGPNQPPEIEIVDARADRAAGSGVRVRWAARDPDGRVKQSRWSLTPWGAPTLGEAGVATTGDECLVTRDPSARVGEPRSREPERFSVWAVDDAGAVSKPATLALFTNNVAPMVVITGPRPSTFFNIPVAPNVCITWTGYDPDGIFTTKPVKYKYKMFDLDDPANQIYVVDPDSLRRYYAPLAWAGWDSTSADTEFVAFSNLTIGKSYLFAVTAFDEQGDYDPDFNLNKNMLRMTVVYPETNSPVLALSGPGFRFIYPSGGWFDLPNRVAHTEVAAGEPVTFNWEAFPVPSHSIRSYRWVMDPVDLHDETPRTNEQTDVRHWSAPSLNVTEATLGPFSPAGLKREEHTLYIEARSTPGGCTPTNSDFVSLGIIHFVVVRATHQREVLIVDDTRLQPDRISAGASCPQLATGAWPSAAELDTFLYARGGFPWRCTINPPSGVTTTGGLFAGYDFDTLGTRGRLSGEQRDNGGGQLSQSQCVPLSVLASYRHVIWITDGNGALATAPITDAANPRTAMRFMSEPRIVNVLAAYVRMGGKLWLAGSTATASLLPWDRVQNNSGGLTRFSSAPQYDELGPGRLMWDSAKLRSELTVASAIQSSRALGRFEPSPGAYGALPVLLQSRTAATDPLPPTRAPNQGSTFYTSNRRAEFLTQPNEILEDIDGDPETYGEHSVLDSLYTVQGGTVPVGSGNVAMTRYHGLEHGEVVWTGFDIWSFQRAQCIELVDAVMQGIWGLPRAPVARGPDAVPALVSAAARPSGWADRWRRAIATKR